MADKLVQALRKIAEFKGNSRTPVKNQNRMRDIARAALAEHAQCGVTITAVSEDDARRMAMALQEVGKEIFGGFLVYESGGLTINIESDTVLLDREDNLTLVTCTREAFVSINGNLRLRRKAR